MRTVDSCQRDVVTIRPEAAVTEAAEQMRRHAVGCLVVAADDGHPVGIVTDRDLAIRVVAAARETGVTPVSAVMSRPPATAREDDTLDDVLEVLRTRGIRRLPVVADHRVVGIISLDDLVVGLGNELENLGRAIHGELRGAHRLAFAREIGRELAGTVRELGEQAERIGTSARDIAMREIGSARERIRKLFG